MVFELFFNRTTVQPKNIKLKLIGLAVRLYQQFWKEMNCQIFLNIILSFAYLMCPSVSRRQALKNMSVICYVQFQWKLTGHFPNRIKNYGVFIQKSLSLKKYFERKNRRHVFVVYVLIYTLFTASASSEKIDSRKTALNMSIRQVIFTSSQNLKPPFLCQYLIFFNDFCFTLEISFGSLL